MFHNQIVIIVSYHHALEQFDLTSLWLDQLLLLYTIPCNIHCASII